jgi:hypothetical protein
MRNEYELALSWECYRLPGVAGPDKWRALLEARLDSDDSPYRFDVHGQSIRLWRSDSPHIKVPNSSHICRNALRVNRVSFNKCDNETLIGISIARLVFENDSLYPTYKSATELFKKGNYPEVLRHEGMLPEIPKLIDFLRGSNTLSAIQPNTDIEISNCQDSIHYVTSRNKVTLHEISTGQGISRNLLKLVRESKAVRPTKIRIGLLSGLSHERQPVALAREVTSVLRGWGCDVSGCSLESPDDVESFINNRESAGVVLVPLNGQRGDRPYENELKWIRYLDSESAAFQLFSVSSNPTYARHGLALSIIGKAGGAHFYTSPAIPSSFNDSWFIGLDLGKGGQREGRIAALTLTAPDGSLRAYWRALKGNTESLPPEVLFNGLSWIKQRAQEIVPSRSFILIRDGSCPNDERITDYQSAMDGAEFTLVEYIKRGTPLMHCGSREPLPGTIILPHDSPFTAIFPCSSPQRGVIGTPAKFRARLNSLQLSNTELANVLIALCHSATLSYQPASVPAPIQWSNGLAKLSYTDLQFAGWSHLPNRTVDLR